MTRQKELSIRLSLGATRGRLISQLLTESVLLAAIGGALGILVAKWSGQLLPGAAGHATAIDWRVLSFVLGVTVVTGLVFGIAPALRATSMNVSATLKEDLATQADQIDKNLQQERVFAQAYALFGALATLLASIGLFGLMSYSVARRTSEIGIRMALGARSRDVLRLVMGESMMLVAIGVGIGVVTAVAASRLVAALLFGLAPTDALTMAGAVTLMVLVSALAGYLPARRAARVDPLVALHYE